MSARRSSPGGRLCTALPELAVVVLDVLPRALELGRHVVISDVAERVELRQHDVADLDDLDSYDLARHHLLQSPIEEVPEVALR